MPSTSPEIKRANIQRFGAKANVVEGYYDDAQEAANVRQLESGALMVHPFDHEDTVAGQGTLARELDEQIGGYDTLIVATGGGGFSQQGKQPGSASASRWSASRPESSQCLRMAMMSGEPVEVPVSGLAADSLGAKRLGAVPWSVVRRYVDKAVLVDRRRHRRRAARTVGRVPSRRRTRRCGGTRRPTRRCVHTVSGRARRGRRVRLEL
jgi:threonine dehydratase